ncbi:ABC transporter permease [Pseudoalteromonas tunicata]|uniref:ABC transporter permease n=1 Tax=Pseudoalteromonas tunicata TaxID=314281 RepID=UPI00273F3D04|nr:ABC transporter permease [Pseudoalteromonas tunicata]MDP4984932.1 ABC transporter permease [Pseudoalteromonas tunicata]
MGYLLLQAWRSLRHHSVFSLNVLFILAVSIGALMAAITLYLQVMVKPLPYPHAEHLYSVKGHIYHQDKPFYSNALSAVAAFDIAQESVFDLASPLVYHDILMITEQASPRLNATFGFATLFELMGMEFELGGPFSEPSSRNAFNHEVVVSYTFWQNQLAGASDVIGTTIRLREQSYRITGVLTQQSQEAELYQPGRFSEVYLPFLASNWVDLMPGHSGAIRPQIKVLGRLNNQFSANQAAQLITPQQQQIFKQDHLNTPFKDHEVRFELVSLKEQLHGKSESTSHTLLLAAIGLLLIALVNVLALFIMRVTEQQKKLAIEMALGATPRQVFTQLLLQTGLLFFISYLLGNAIAYILLQQVQFWGSHEFSLLSRLALSWPVQLAVLGLCVGLAIVFALIALLNLNAKQLILSLRQSGKGAAQQLSTAIKQGLLVAQLTLALLLVAAMSSIMLWSWQALNTPLGFNEQNLYLLQLEQPDFDYNGEVYAAKKHQALALLTAIQQLPEVNSAALAMDHPLEYAWFSAVNTEFNEATQINAYGHGISAAFFNTTEQTILAGRTFSDDEVNNGARVMLINQTVANKLGLTYQDIGRTLYSRQPDQPYTLIGIVKDIHQPNVGPIDRVYLPVNFYHTHTLIRTQNGIKPSINTLNKLIQQLNPQARVLAFISVADFKSAAFKYQRLALWSSFLLGSFALLIAASGIYSLLNYQHTLSRAQMGMHLLLGATTSRFIVLQAIAMLSLLLKACLLLAVCIGLLFLLSAPNGFASWLTINALIIKGIIVSVLLVAAVLLISAWHTSRALLTSWPMHNLRS